MRMWRRDLEFNLLIVSVLLFSFINFIPSYPNLGFLLSFAAMIRYFRIRAAHLVMIIFVLLINLLIVLLGPCSDYAVRSSVSLMLVIVFLFSVNNFTKEIYIESSNSIKYTTDNVMKFSVMLVFISILIEFIYMKAQRPSGIFFAEPSHVGLLVVPLALYFVLRKNIYFTMIGFATLLLSYSSSGMLALLCMLVLLVSFVFLRLCFYLRIKWFHIFIALSVLVLIFSLLSNAGTSERLQGVLARSNTESGVNLSSLVYLNGWQAAFEYMKGTNLLGVGFNLMGCDGGVPTALSPLIIEISGGYLNYNDGSFLIAKLISELGLFSLFLVFVLASPVSIALNLIFSVLFRNKMVAPFDIFASIFFLTGCIFLFIRGAGYFSIPFPYIIFGYCILLNTSRYGGSIVLRKTA